MTPSLAQFLNKKLTSGKGTADTNGRHSVILPRGEVEAGSISNAIKQAVAADVGYK